MHHEHGLPCEHRIEYLVDRSYAKLATRGELDELAAAMFAIGQIDQSLYDEVRKPLDEKTRLKNTELYVRHHATTWICDRRRETSRLWDQLQTIDDA